MEIKRDAYLEQLKIRKDNGMIKIITGIRRCGKSFLLFVLFKKYLLESGVDNDHIIEIALDALENLQKIIANKQMLFQRAFRTDSTEIEITDEKINFTWFPYTVDGDVIAAYT